MSTTALVLLGIAAGIILLSLGLRGIRRLVFLVGAFSAVLLWFLIYDGRLTLGQIFATLKFWDHGRTHGPLVPEDHALTLRLNALGRTLRLEGAPKKDDTEDLLEVQNEAVPPKVRVAALRRLARRCSAITSSGRTFDEPALALVLEKRVD